jgi:chemotaxis protein CheY-P-specific phosphatase CheC
MGAGRETQARDEAALRELAGVGSASAAALLTRLLGCSVREGSPAARDRGTWRPALAWQTAILFDAEGALAGRLAVLLSSDASDRIVRKLVGELHEAPEGVDESALREFGNMIASKTVSAIVDVLGGRILISIPHLVSDADDAALRSGMDGRGATLCIETALYHADGTACAALVLIPDAWKPHSL